MSRRHCVLTLRISLQHSQPCIWRRFVVGGHIHLGYLHHVIQAAMGWSDAHLHEFQIDGTKYAPPDLDGELAPSEDERRVVLSSILKRGQEFFYLYDFGDSWMHSLAVEEVAKVNEALEYAYVLEGERTCPPEDSGGIHGYQEFLRQFAEAPASDEVSEFLEWAGNDFDPARFDRHATNAALLRMASNRWGR